MMFDSPLEKTTGPEGNEILNMEDRPKFSPRRKKFELMPESKEKKDVYSIVIYSKSSVNVYSGPFWLVYAMTNIRSFAGLK